MMMSSIQLLMVQALGLSRLLDVHGCACTGRITGFAQPVNGH